MGCTWIRIIYTFLGYMPLLEEEEERGWVALSNIIICEMLV
jgi:hypothetical protein